MVWYLIVLVYAAPDDAVDWNGPWKLGMAQLLEEPHATQAECRAVAVRLIDRLHQGMRAPIRYRCVGAEAGLPKNAPR